MGQAGMYGHMTPYQYAANNPIKYIDVNGDSIPSYFFDNAGNMSSDIPSAVQQNAACEYGIGLGYNETTHKMYYAGDVETDNPISQSGRAELLKALGAGTTNTTLLFGYNLYYELGTHDKVAVSGGSTNGAYSYVQTAMIDLADFDANGQLKGLVANQLYVPRSFNLMRFIEHEFYGHGQKNYSGREYDEKNSNVPYLNRTFSNIPQIPARKDYTEVFRNGGELRWDGKTKIDQKGYKIDYDWLYRSNNNIPSPPKLKTK